MGTLRDLLESEGMNRHEFIEAYTLESCVPGICTNADCDNVEYYEPDQTEGWCSCCDTTTVKSGLVMLGVI